MSHHTYSVFQWKWELLRRTGDGESRAVVVLALPPPDQAARVDMDTLDCLQQVRSKYTSSDIRDSIWSALKAGIGKGLRGLDTTDCHQQGLVDSSDSGHRLTISRDIKSLY